MGSARPQTARSLHGCWTCRLRRKKCDETHPSCSICVGLGLACFGYGPRPTWMDGGVAEKEQAMRVKRIIKRKKRMRRGLPQIQSTPVIPPQGLLTATPSSRNPLSVPALPSPFDKSGAEWVYDEQAPSQSYSSNLELHGPDQPTPHSLELHPSMPGEHNFVVEGNSVQSVSENPTRAPTRTEESCLAEPPFLKILTSHPLENTSWLDYTVSETSGCKSADTNQPTSSDEDVSAQKEVVNDDTVWMTSHGEHFFKPRTLETTEPSATEHLVNQPLAIEPTTFADSVLHIGEKSDEAILFMHYLDYVFYVQFPFYNSSLAHGSRGWILSLLMRDRSVYHAALALSQYHRHLRFPSKSHTIDGIHSYRHGEEYHILALRELQDVIGETHTWRGTKGLVRSVQVLTCSLHLLYFEVLSGATGPWPMHLSAAATLVPQIAKALTPPSETSPNLGSKNELEDMIILSSEDYIPMSLLLSSFIWFDILACASIGSRPFLDLDQVSLLEGTSIHMEELTGCENWVLVQIFKISQLRTWKKESQSSHRLSVAELARRGSQIETCLREKLAQISLQGTEYDSLQISAGPLTSAIRVAITKIYALSALTYVHVTVFGANCQIPEIIDSVSKTVDSFSALTDWGLLRYLVWPFCVTACMALKEQHSFFRSLDVAAEKVETISRTWMEAFRVVEECWNMRERTSGNCDWISVMETLGRRILLA